LVTSATGADEGAANAGIATSLMFKRILSSETRDAFSRRFNAAMSFTIWEIFGDTSVDANLLRESVLSGLDLEAIRENI
jgi:hypothetical protein